MGDDPSNPSTPRPPRGYDVISQFRLSRCRLRSFLLTAGGFALALMLLSFAVHTAETTGWTAADFSARSVHHRAGIPLWLIYNDFRSTGDVPDYLPEAEKAFPGFHLDPLRAVIAIVLALVVGTGLARLAIPIARRLQQRLGPLVYLSMAAALIAPALIGILAIQEVRPSRGMFVIGDEVLETLILDANRPDGSPAIIAVFLAVPPIVAVATTVLRSYWLCLINSFLAAIAAWWGLRVGIAFRLTLGFQSEHAIRLEDAILGASLFAVIWIVAMLAVFGGRLLWPRRKTTSESEHKAVT